MIPITADDFRPTDVFLGMPGRTTLRGNLQFRKSAQERKEQYRNAADRDERKKLIYEIINDIHSMDPPGRFLMRHMKTYWYEPSLDLTFVKINHTMRAKLRKAPPRKKTSTEKPNELKKKTTEQRNQTMTQFKAVSTEIGQSNYRVRQCLASERPPEESKKSLHEATSTNVNHALKCATQQPPTSEICSSKIQYVSSESKPNFSERCHESDSQKIQLTSIAKSLVKDDGPSSKANFSQINQTEMSQLHQPSNLERSLAKLNCQSVQTTVTGTIQSVRTEPRQVLTSERTLAKRDGPSTDAFSTEKKHACVYQKTEPSVTRSNDQLTEIPSRQRNLTTKFHLHETSTSEELPGVRSDVFIGSSLTSMKPPYFSQLDQLSTLGSFLRTREELSAGALFDQLKASLRSQLVQPSIIKSNDLLNDTSLNQEYPVLESQLCQPSLMVKESKKKEALFKKLGETISPQILSLTQPSSEFLFAKENQLLTGEASTRVPELCQSSTGVGMENKDL